MINVNNIKNQLVGAVQLVDNSEFRIPFWIGIMMVCTGAAMFIISALVNAIVLIGGVF